MSRGKFIVFEGLNGCGKGTQMRRAAGYIYELSRSNLVTMTREPNKLDENGKRAREMLKSDGDPYENNELAARYFAENRRTHNGFLEPFLEAGFHVLCDRYYHSNFAYQHAQRIPLEEIARVNQGVLVPDLTIIFTTNPQESARRKLASKDKEKGRKFDSDIEFNGKVFQNYRRLGEVLPELIGDKGIVYVDGAGTKEETWKKVKEFLDGMFVV